MKLPKFMHYIASEELELLANKEIQWCKTKGKGKSPHGKKFEEGYIRGVLAVVRIARQLHTGLTMTAEFIEDLKK